MLVLALAGLTIAGYLTLYQVGAIATPWDPIFGAGQSSAVLNSFLSRMLPVPDAFLGVLGYLADAILTSLGSERRWREAPWLVLALGVVVAGLALGSLGLVFLQAAVIHAWCTLCLTSAAISFLIFGFALDEVLAAIARVRRRVAQ